MNTLGSYDFVIITVPHPPKGAPVPAPLLDMRYSLNSSLPSTAAKITACVPSTTSIEVKIEVGIHLFAYLA